MYNIIFMFLANAEAKIKFDLKIVKKKNNKNFIEIKPKKINLELGAVKLHFSNLFNGNKQLGKNFEVKISILVNFFVNFFVKFVF